MAKQFVFEAEKELEAAGIALPGAAADELPVDAACRVHFGRDDMQPAIAAGDVVEQDVRPATGHVGRDGHCAASTGARHDLRLLRRIAGVEHFVPDATRREHGGQRLEHRVTEDGIHYVTSWTLFVDSPAPPEVQEPRTQ